FQLERHGEGRCLSAGSPHGCNQSVQERQGQRHVRVPRLQIVLGTHHSVLSRPLVRGEHVDSDMRYAARAATDSYAASADSDAHTYSQATNADAYAHATANADPHGHPNAYTHATTNADRHADPHRH